MSKTRSSPVVPAKNKIIKSQHFSLGTAKVIFFPRTNMSTFKDGMTLLLESYLDGVIDDDEFILQYTMKPSQFSPEKVVAISNCPFINFEMNSSFRRPLRISFISQLCSFLFQWRDQQPWFPGTTFHSEENSRPLAS